jgi:DNA-binding response OmpR family regulator
MPVMDGISMIEKIRDIDKNIPIVIFSAYDKSGYFLQTISFGIDGYILKPYDFKQIINVITKIVTKFDIEVKFKNTIKLDGDFCWDKEKSELIKDKKNIKLTKNEIKLFEILSSSKDRIMSNEDIEEYIFDDETMDNKRVRNLISRLKVKLNIILIESNYGNGYKLKKPETI